MAFLVFEGLDGAGKSTLISSLHDHLVSLGLSVVVTREPGGTPLAEEIRELILKGSKQGSKKEQDIPVTRSEILLYQAGRAQHVEKVIRPQRDRGGWVLCDRYIYSTVAFQGGGRLLSLSDVEWLNEFAINHVHPDLVILVDLPVDVALKRIKSREIQKGQKKDRFEQENKNFHEAVRRSYLEQVHRNPTHWLVLDGENSPQQLLFQLLQVLEQKRWLVSSTDL